MLPDRVSNPGPLTYESGVLPIALRGPATCRLTAMTFLRAPETGKASTRGTSDIFHLDISHDPTSESSH